MLYIPQTSINIKLYKLQLLKKNEREIQVAEKVLKLMKR